MFRVLAFLAWPLIEIALFVVIGGEIGLWATLGWILATAVLGIILLRAEAERGARVLRGGMRGGATLPEGAAVSGLFRALAAVLLMLPGFFGDAVGVLLLLPPVQALLSAAVVRRVAVFQSRGFGGTAGFGNAGGRAGHAQGSPDDIIDGEWVEVPPEAGRNRRPSAWTEAQIEAQVVDDPDPRRGNPPRN